MEECVAVSSGECPSTDHVLNDTHETAPWFFYNPIKLATYSVCLQIFLQIQCSHILHKDWYSGGQSTLQGMAGGRRLGNEGLNYPEFSGNLGNVHLLSEGGWVENRGSTKN